MPSIYCISDTHSSFYNLEIIPADILIHAGDITSKGSKEQIKEFNCFLKYIEEFYKHIIVIAGNHDKCFQSNRKECEGILLDSLNNAYYLQDDNIELYNKKIYGSPNVLKFSNTAFGHTEEGFEEKFKNVEADIIISHMPCYKILDSNIKGYNCGSKSLRNIILNKIKPEYFISGHIHEASGAEIINSTTFINASSILTRKGIEIKQL